MPARFARHPSVRNAALTMLGLAMVGGAVAAAGGLFRFLSAGELGAALLALAGLGLAALSVLLFLLLDLIGRVEHYAFRSYDSMLDLVELTRRQTDLAHTVAENSSLSEWAKRLMFREKDYEYLRDMIEGAIARQEWDVAAHLIQELADGLGRREESAALSASLASARDATAEERLLHGLERFEKLCAARRWPSATKFAERMLKIYPDDRRVAALPALVQERREQHKQTLLREYDQAVRARDLDRAHDLLLELDSYLSPNEGAALKESARGVFKAKLLQLGVQFSLAVSERAYDRAIASGEAVIREFPNSRYAREIQAMLPTLRARAKESLAG